VENGGLRRTIADSCKQLRTVSYSHLSSVSPRHSYCNWASPVTLIAFRDPDLVKHSNYVKLSKVLSTIECVKYLTD